MIDLSECKLGEAVAEKVDKKEITKYAIITLLNYSRQKHEHNKSVSLEILVN